MLKLPNKLQESFNIGQLGSIKLSDSRLNWDQDARGIIFSWEAPDPSETYFMGIDPTQGLTGWSRYNRTDGDRKTNNGAIEIIRAGRFKRDVDGNVYRSKDVQVCEFASPNDPVELARYADMLGRLYGGKLEQCLCIIETYPGPGSMTLREMIRLGYSNHWAARKMEKIPDPSYDARLGWKANKPSLQDLWQKCARHINTKSVLIRSPFLHDELADMQPNVQLGYAESPNNMNGHGDRVRAFNLALYACNEWDPGVERPVRQPITSPSTVPFYASDVSMEDYQDFLQETMERFGV